MSSGSVGIVAGALAGCAAEGPAAEVAQVDAVRSDLGNGAVVSTDPPYYDNVPYADLSVLFLRVAASFAEGHLPRAFCHCHRAEGG